MIPCASANQPPVPESITWYNCKTREVWTKEKSVWCKELSKLQNTQYQLPDIGEFNLTNGKYKNDAERKVVFFQNTPGTINYDRLPDGTKIATVLLSSNTGGSGIFIHLVVMKEVAGQYQTLATQFLGDRVWVKSVKLAEEQIKVQLIKQGEAEPQCCPTLEVVQTYNLADGKLEQLAEEKIGNVPLDPGRRLFTKLEIPDQVIGEDPLQIAKNLYGAKEIPSEGNFQEELTLIERVFNQPVVLLTQTGLLDDSVEGTRYRLEFKPQGKQWQLIWVGQQNRCYPDRGSQEWNLEPCL
ncbi:hypothetical protein Sta7437_2133 [Stanieria cyanosphaera PCC 7437]|uniref:Uncharacterized protein n=2 Tax=Stanieria cyanosphaera TaxID=102116 RepID=K9XT27_STAC7|nr:hypothetical protein Sta7437_2133 [Stanieria cyanosphaera PCC 7437]